MENDIKNKLHNFDCLSVIKMIEELDWICLWDTETLLTILNECLYSLFVIFATRVIEFNN